MIDDKYIELINSYLDDDLTGDKLKNFENLLISNQNLAEYLDFVKDLKLSMERQIIINQFKNLEQELNLQSSGNEVNWYNLTWVKVIFGFIIFLLFLAILLTYFDSKAEENTRRENQIKDEKLNFGLTVDTIIDVALKIDNPNIETVNTSEFEVVNKKPNIKSIQNSELVQKKLNDEGVVFTVWTRFNIQEPANVYIDNELKGKLEFMIPEGEPVCGQEGTLSFKLLTGTYEYFVESGQKTWKGVVQVKEGISCFKFELPLD